DGEEGLARVGGSQDRTNFERRGLGLGAANRSLGHHGNMGWPSECGKRLFDQRLVLSFCGCPVKERNGHGTKRGRIANLTDICVCSHTFSWLSRIANHHILLVTPVMESGHPFGTRSSVGGEKGGGFALRRRLGNMHV